MIYSDNIKQILKNYENTNAGVKSNLGRILMNGKLGGLWMEDYRKEFEIEMYRAERWTFIRRR